MLHCCIKFSRWNSCWTHTVAAATEHSSGKSSSGVPHGGRHATLLNEMVASVQDWKMKAICTLGVDGGYMVALHISMHGSMQAIHNKFNMFLQETIASNCQGSTAALQGSTAVRTAERGTLGLIEFHACTLVPTAPLTVSDLPALRS